MDASEWLLPDPVGRAKPLPSGESEGDEWRLPDPSEPEEPQVEEWPQPDQPGEEQSRYENFPESDSTGDPSPQADAQEWLLPDCVAPSSREPAGRAQGDEWVMHEPPQVALSVPPVAVASEMPPTDKLADLNSVNFEALRGIGLSATQSARVLARREHLGAYTSIAQLDDLFGFPEHHLERLKSQVQVGGTEPR